jgi:hypothetical protein
MIFEASLIVSLVKMGSTIFSKKAPNKKVDIKMTAVEIPVFFMIDWLILKNKKLNPFIHFTFVNP